MFKYGTAGFRYKATLLPNVVYRLGYGFAGLFNGSSPAAYGVMFTASHNPADDNGVKIVYRGGSSLRHAQIEYLEHLVNLSDADFQKLLEGHNATEGDEALMKIEHLLDLAKHVGMEAVSESSTIIEKKDIIILARDTRETGEELQKMFQLGFEQRNKNGVVFLDAGYMPTATHHYVVANFYNYPNPLQDSLAALLEYGFNSKSKSTVYVDCTNGVGSLWVENYFKSCPHIEVQLLNTNYQDFKLLNHKCGADYVQGSRKIPEGVPYEKLPSFTRVYHLDGDCDRMVISFMDDNKDFHIFDGDHIIMLFATYIQKVMPVNDNGFTIGIVYTAYANGGFSKWLTDCAAKSSSFIPLKAGTGVAKLIKVSEAADMAIYSEPNGHGSIIVKPEHEATIMKTPLARLLKLTNACVGDGIANIRAIEFMLDQLGWSTRDWLNNTFVRFPTKLLKIPVSNTLNYASNSENEEILDHPKHLQNFLQRTLVNFSSKFGHCHAFMRPSGTENYMRLKVDMDSDEPKILDLLADVLTDAVYLNEEILMNSVSQ